MKILFLHLSDIHFKETTNYNNINIKGIVKSLVQMDNFDKCILVFSGDIAHSGKTNQYKIAKTFIGNLITEIRNKYNLRHKTIETLIVPGNHDNLSTNSSRGIEELKNYYTLKKEEENFYKDLEQLNNFYSFSKRNKCYINEKVIDIRNIVIDEFKIKVNLINSAPFSLLCKANEDKGMHYLPDKEIEKLDSEINQNYTISIIHHSPEWFNDKCKQKLYNKLYETSDFIFIGHDHFALNENKIVKGKNINVSSGVALYGTNTEHGFNAFILDVKNLNLSGKKFIYDGSIYKPENLIENKKVRFRGKNKFTPTEEFENFLKSDIKTRKEKVYLDYFVFPSLELKNINNKSNDYSVSSEEQFIELLKKEHKISIEGNSQSGKTILSKYICNILLNDYVPLYINAEKLSTKNNKNAIKNILEEQYGKNADIDEFFQMDANKKVVIVDEYDLIKKERWQSFWDEYQKYIGYLVLFCEVKWDLNIKEKTIEELSKDRFLQLKICPFYYSKREELIKKICNNHLQDKTNINEKVKKINEHITNEIKYFQLNPDFIQQFVEYYINYPTFNDNQTNIFSKVFEGNISFRIKKNIYEENISEVMIALDFIAYHIHFNKKYPFSIKDFMEAIDEYNKQYDNQLKWDNIYKIAKNSNIIRDVNNYNESGIEFCDKNLLAYFVSLHLNRALNEDLGIEKLIYVLDNICFPPNGDILLFLSYITSNVKILDPIMASIINHMEDWKELDFDTKNIRYLSKIRISDEVKIPTEKDKKQIKDKKNNIEKNIIENENKESNKLYSYDESKIHNFSNKIKKSINYLELVAKILPNFRYMLKSEQKKKIINILYTYPNKLLYFMLKDIDINYDDIINEILKSAPKTEKGKLITEGIVSQELQNQSLGYILSIYDFIACTVTSNDKTMTDLNKFDYFNYKKNTNYMIQNIMMEENVGNFSALSEKAIELYKNTNLDIYKKMISLIVRKYFLCHDIQITGKAQSTLDFFFSKNEKQKEEIKILQAKNRTIKK
ncbi:MAG: metallophosphoesterase [Clostridiales bacterium]|nr:metallophosphoesterase [Clostridiales bacterium]